jgi:ribonucleoside-diphosphate reductase alpha chain
MAQLDENTNILTHLNDNYGPQRKLHDTIEIDISKNEKITGFGHSTFKQQYLLPGENPQTLYARVTAWLSSNPEHAQRMYTYLSNHWFSPATPILSNAGTTRGKTISCYLLAVQDSMESIIDKWKEQAWLAAKGGGIGLSWGNVRSRSEKVGMVGTTSGIVPFLKVCESLTLAISQGSLRRGNAAMYLPVWHPEIEEFLEIRKPSGGDPERKTLHLHHGIVVDDAFMQAIENNLTYNLRSPKTNETIKTVNARDLWIRILTTRLETGEPYLIFIDNALKFVPEHHQELGLLPKTSNLCSEIILPTGIDYNGNDRTAVCCLASLNLEYWDEWKDNSQFIPDVMEFLDNVLIDYCENNDEKMANAVYAAANERSVGLGVMGFHSLLQSKMIPWESAVAKSLNLKIFKHIKASVDKASRNLAIARGPCADAVEYTKRTGKEFLERFSYKTAVAPTATISTLTGQCSPGIEPYAANAFKQVVMAGSLNVKNKYLEQLLEKYGKNNSETWEDILQNKGSVQHLEFLTANEKDVFKTARELDQRWLIEFAGDRTQYIDQAQSLNIFLPNDIHKADLHKLHMMAWKKGVKSLYYCRSNAAKTVDSLTRDLTAMQNNLNLEKAKPKYDDTECLACQ